MGVVGTAGQSRSATIFERTYPGHPAQVSQVRRDLAQIAEGCPVADELILLASELCANAVLHSRSGQPYHHFTVLAEVHPGDFVWIEVEDQGGAWDSRERDDCRPHGLDLVRAIAGEGNWGVDGDGLRGRVVWARVDWPMV